MCNQQAFSASYYVPGAVLDRHLGTAMDLPIEVLIAMRSRREAKDLVLGLKRTAMWLKVCSLWRRRWREGRGREAGTEDREG